MSTVMASPRQINRTAVSSPKESVKKGVIYLEYEITTPTGPRIIAADKEAERITGYSEKILLGQPFGMIYDPDGLESFLKLLHSKVCHSDDFCWSEKFLMRKGGGKKMHRWTFSPLRSGKGTIHGFAVTMEALKDRAIETTPPITESAVSKEDLSSCLDDSRSETLALVAGGIAHDFKNILQPIMSTLEMARLTSQRGSRTESLIKEAELALQDAVVLAKQMQALTTGYESDLQIVHLTEMLNQVSHISTIGTDVKHYLSISDDLLPVNADPGQLYQVFQNMIINACQAMPEGGLIQISAQNANIQKEESGIAPGSYVAIKIRDRGCGISKENLAKIFQSDFTTKENGSGVGLASCQAIVNRHGGKVLVNSTLNAGTEFIVLLPTCEVEHESKTSNSSCCVTLNRVESVIQSSSDRLSNIPMEGCFSPPREIETADADKGAGRVLIVDDQVRVLTTAEKLLQFLGYETVSATSGEDAITIYREHMNSSDPIDAVLLDMTLPGGLSGNEVKREIKRVDEDARIIATSGYFEDEHAVESFLNEGWSGVLPKPYAIDALSKTVSRAILHN